jgi:hypothetical protein
MVFMIQAVQFDCWKIYIIYSFIHFSDKFVMYTYIAIICQSFLLICNSVLVPCFTINAKA